MPNEQTPYLKLPLPHPDNLLEADVERLREALQLVDANAGNMLTALMHKADADSVNTALAELNELAVALAFPSGIIAMWSGAEDAVPSGWSLCDGKNGTPDLRGRFIVGSGDAYTTGNIGGAEKVTFTGSVSNTVAGGVVADTTITTGTMPNHYHTFYGGSPGQYIGFCARGYAGGGNHALCNNAEPNIASHNNVYMNWSGGGDGAHNHGFTGGSHGHTFTVAALENRPPYYALAYIMKI